MYRISEILSGGQARSDHWIYERAISNTLSNLILDSTSTILTYITAQIRSPARLTSAASYTSKILRKKIRNPHEAYDFPSALIFKLQSQYAIFNFHVCM